MKVEAASIAPSRRSSSHRWEETPAVPRNRPGRWRERTSEGLARNLATAALIAVALALMAAVYFGTTMLMK